MIDPFGVDEAYGGGRENIEIGNSSSPIQLQGNPTELYIHFKCIKLTDAKYWNCGN